VNQWEQNVMIRKKVQELKIVVSRTALPSVEVQMESLEEQGLHLVLIVAQALSKFAAHNPHVTATVYSYATTSFNFENQPGFSEFLVVAGDKSVLKALGGAFIALKGVKSRYSDYVSPSDCIPSYHIEGGRLWEPEDVATWYSAETGNSVEDEVEDDWDDESPVNAGNGFQAAIQGLGELFSLESDENDGEVVSSTSTKRVGRAARADASVGAIRRKIEEDFGLPTGSVALCGPDGRALRSDARIKTLRRRWEDE
jgi:hypothetical protein